MTDIVERARKAASQGDFYLHNSLVYELIDEVERLRAQVAETVPGAAREAEVERLQNYKRLQAEDIMTLGQQVGKLEAEIERLYSLRSAEITAYNKRIDELEAETERLRAENMELRAERLLLQSWMPRSKQGPA
jgi:hypothetical protein